jgi:hypothetical protein
MPTLGVFAAIFDDSGRIPNDEISEMGYFGRDELPEPMGLGARTRIIDALDGITGIVRVIPDS